MKRNIVSKLKQLSVALMASNNLTRPLLNSFYLRLSPAARSHFHHHYSKLFRRRNYSIQDGHWSVPFLGRRIRLPLTRNEMWLDWDTAVSVIGHDIEIKNSYENILRSADRPDVFFDVGANYGTHSLLLASQGVQVVAFEPNAICIAKGKQLLSANDLPVRWEHVAVGEEQGEISLYYPEKDTWLGTTNPDLLAEMPQQALRKEDVKLVLLDVYLPDVEGKKLLMKIDVEGLEIEVLKGGRDLLLRSKPFIIFESNDDARRGELFDLLESLSYNVVGLPWVEGPKRPLTRSEFLGDSRTNFGALSAT